jgi:hypothetical protein
MAVTFQLKDTDWLNVILKNEKAKNLDPTVVCKKFTSKD